MVCSLRMDFGSPFLHPKCWSVVILFLENMYLKTVYLCMQCGRKGIIESWLEHSLQKLPHFKCFSQVNVVTLTFIIRYYVTIPLSGWGDAFMNNVNSLFFMLY
jgi:DNA-directed RNA polymerase subunit RPC12/RpoP